jgi:hypothetical protein
MRVQGRSWAVDDRSFRGLPWFVKSSICSIYFSRSVSSLLCLEVVMDDVIPSTNRWRARLPPLRVELRLGLNSPFDIQLEFWDKPHGQFQLGSGGRFGTEAQMTE